MSKTVDELTVNPGTNLLLKGRLGSTAFGLATPKSDEDFGGIFAVPTTMLHGMRSVKDSYQYKNPDTWYHEAGKYCKLALKCNPTALDLLWIEHYNLRTVLGTELVNLRDNFLSRVPVQNAYYYFAVSQLDKIMQRNAEVARPEKHARHMLRILHQGFELFSTGQYSVRLQDPQKFMDFGEEVGKNKNFDLAKEVLTEYKYKFENTVSALPDKPHVEPIEDWLLKVRHELYRYSDINTTETMEKP